VIGLISKLAEGFMRYFGSGHDSKNGSEREMGLEPTTFV